MGATIGGAVSATILVGCAGWSIPGHHALLFPTPGAHLARYGARLSAVEINSSFYRPHRRTTYARWAATVPDDFAFAVKLPRQITHELRLLRTDAALDAFLAQASGLGRKLGPLLVQLPPSLRFEPRTAGAFFAVLRARFAGSAVCEPRHPSWFAAEPDQLLRDFRIARVAADPSVTVVAMEPGGWDGLVYFRLHGSPRVYYSEYGDEALDRIARRLAAAGVNRARWCIFDNTAAGAATINALALKERLRRLDGGCKSGEAGAPAACPPCSSA